MTIQITDYFIAMIDDADVLLGWIERYDEY